MHIYSRYTSTEIKKNGSNILAILHDPSVSKLLLTYI